MVCYMANSREPDVRAPQCGEAEIRKMGAKDFGQMMQQSMVRARPRN